MDIWRWVHEQVASVAREDRALAEQLLRLPSWTLDGDHGRVDAALPVIVARVQALGLPWLEVFARHWGLQSRVLHRHDVRGDSLKEAVALLERAHRPDAAGCPQSVCVAQDVCAAYRIVDGPGHARQRIAVAKETLARIDPSWSCFRCLTEELVDAMADAGEPEEALAWLDRQALELKRAGVEEDFLQERSELLHLLGRYEEALDAARRHDVSAQGQSGLVTRALGVASNLAALGRFAEALEEAPPWPAVRSHVQNYPPLLETWRRAIAAGALPWDLEHLAAVSEMVRTLAAHEAHRLALDEALAFAGLCLDRGDVSMARVLLELAEGRLPHLAAPLGADEACARLRARVEAARPAPYAPEELVGEALDFDRLEATVAGSPEHVEQVARVARHWQRRGWPEVADRVMAAAVAAHPLDPRVLDLRLSGLAQEGRWTDLAAALDALPAALPPEAELQRRWYRGVLRAGSGDPAGAAAELAWAWAHLRSHAGPGLARRLAGLLQEAGDPRGALAVIDEVVVQPWSNAGDHWFRMELATLLERWDVVRASAAAVGLPLSGTEGPIEDEGELLALLIPARDGELWALRTGPCTARVVSITGPEDPEQFGAVWAFDPFPVGEGPPRQYRGHRELTPADGVSFAIDGDRLTDEEVERIGALARSHGGQAFRASGDAYTMWSPEDESPHPASYVKVALRGGSEAVPELAALVEAITRAHPRPVVWPALRERVGDHEGAARDRATAEAWGF